MAKRGRGRPPKRPKDRVSAAINMRTTVAHKRALETAARANGSSLGAEMRRRIEQSIRDDRIEALLRQILDAIDRRDA